MSADGGDGRPLPRPPPSGPGASRRMSWGLQRPHSKQQPFSITDEQYPLDLAEETAEAVGLGLGHPSATFDLSEGAGPSSPARRHREASLAALTGGPRLSLNTAPAPSNHAFNRKSSGESFASRLSSTSTDPRRGSGAAFIGSPPRHQSHLPTQRPGASPGYDDLPTPKRPQRPVRTSTGMSSPSALSASDPAPSSSSRAQPVLRLPVSPTKDTPQTRAQMHSLNRRLAALRPHVKATQHAAEEVAQLLDSLAEAEQRLTAEMSQLGDMLEDGVVENKGGLRRLWAEDGLVGRQLRERREERASLEQSIVEPLRAWSDALKEAERDRLGKRGVGFDEEIKSLQQYTSKYLGTPASRDSSKLDAAYEKRQRDSDVLRFQIQSHLLDLTFGPRYTSLYVNLLTFPSLLLNQQSVPPNPAIREELESTLLAANDLNSAVQDWPFHRMRHERAILEAGAAANGSAVAEEDWESVEGALGGLGISSDGIVGGERKRDRLGSKLRAAVGNLTGNRSPGASPSSQPPPMFPSTSQALPAPPRSREEKKHGRHSLQMMPKSSSAWGLSSAASKNDITSTKGIRDLDPTWLAMKESEGRKKEGWLWCGGDKKGGPWDRCWCEVKQSHLVEHLPNAEGGETEIRTDLMFASAREMRKADRRFAFEIITSKSTRRYQATSDLEMNRWIAALGNAIEASITGTASLRGGSGSASPSISSLISSDDLGLKTFPSASSVSDQYGVGIGLGLPLPPEKDAAPGGFPALRGWGNDLSRKVSLRNRSKHQSHQHSPSESISSKHGGVFDIRGPASGTPPPLPSGDHHKRQHHRSQSYFPSSAASSSSAGGPKLNFISASPMGTPTQPSSGGHLLPPLGSTSRLSFESSGSDRSFDRSGGPSRSSSFLRDDIDLHIDRFVSDLAASSSPDLSLGTGARFDGASSVDRRAVSEGSSFDAPPTPVLTIREIAQRADNATCLDCRRPNPRWATISLNDTPVCGFICLGCSGVHRSLGTHVSKVRSVDLDNWKESDIAIAAATGNGYINAIWEAVAPWPEERTDPQQFIPRKYVQERYRK